MAASISVKEDDQFLLSLPFFPFIKYYPCPDFRYDVDVANTPEGLSDDFNIVDNRISQEQNTESDLLRWK
ncbi:hypothetical protein PABG_11211 [Paracoccidioides brasiliensis Pb03]|nr:hypothetical protein PABG_11211 [Paracoccidioides brasiliensis Pb03]